MKNMFVVDTKGFRQLMGGRAKWQFGRELISNSLDESSVTAVHIELEKIPRKCKITVTDDGKGFANLSDAYTLFAYTPKRKDTTVRGRFNMGEKELASIAHEMTVWTTTGMVKFKDGELHRHPRKKRPSGTMVSAVIPMSNPEYDQLIDMLMMFIYPEGITITITEKENGEYKKSTNPNPKFWETKKKGEWYGALPTVKLNPETNFMSRTTLMTRVDIHGLMEDGDGVEQNKGWLFELGIPVQEIDCDYNVNVQQKIPMNANRDEVRDSYLSKIYAVVLNVIHKELTDNTKSEEWTRVPSKDNLADMDAMKTVKDIRYGEKAVRWSNNHRANEKAEAMGFNVIRRNELSKSEKEKFGKLGLVSANEKFPTSFKSAEAIPRDEWTAEMLEYERVTKKTSKMLRGKSVTVSYIKDIEISDRATYGSKHITYNLARYAKYSKLDTMALRNLETIIHELAHDIPEQDGWGHRKEFQARLQTYAGMLLLWHLNGLKS